MSIVTKSGDKGTTALLYGKRVPKSHPRVEACGTVDELNSALGLARALAEDAPIQERIKQIQSQLIPLMGELATESTHRERYRKEGFSGFKEEFTASLEGDIQRIESQGVTFEGWALPGGSLPGAALDVARSVCRRAERTVCVLAESETLIHPEIVIYLNRLSDLLWLMARQADSAVRSRVGGK